MESYQNYRPTQWYYNAGEHPTDQILKKFPNLVYRVKKYFGVQNLIAKLYSAEHWPDWREYYAMHLLSRHDGAPPAEDLNETAIQNMNTLFGIIARHILYS